MSSGASPATLAFFESLKRQTVENNLCFECGRQNPQWASVNCGLLICLDCSGKHRGLGVHLSFVRSLTMDEWSDRQKAFMTAGGNTRAKEWCERYSVSESDLKNKYSLPAWEAYREKLKAAVENRDYVDPSPEDIAAKTASMSSFGSRSGGSSAYSLSRSSDLRSSSGTWSTAGGAYGASRSSSGYHSPSSEGRYDNTGDIRSSGDDFRSRFGSRTAIGSHDFDASYRGSPKPNQGGDDDLMNALYDGWSRFSTGVKQVATTAADKVSSGTLTEEVSQLASKVTESQPWNYVTSLLSSVTVALTEGQPGTANGSSGNNGGRAMPPPTRDDRFYSSDRLPPPSNGHHRSLRDGSFSDEGERANSGDRYADDEYQQPYDRYGGHHHHNGSDRRSAAASGGGYGSSSGIHSAPNRSPAPGGGAYLNGNGGSRSPVPSRSDSWGTERMDSSRPTGERQSLKYDSRDPASTHGHRAASAQSAARWGGSKGDWDDWDQDNDDNPHVASTEDDVTIEDYRPTKAGQKTALRAPQPTRATAIASPGTPATTTSSASDDIYDFQVTPTSSSRSTPVTNQGTTNTNAPGWEDWDDWSRSKK